jgi:hypothetical protein
MKVFVSWSGKRGKKIGEAFKTWLPDVIQSVEPFYSPDIEKGERWSSEIEQNLRDSKIGIICITPESMLSPWLMFESGAISNAKLSRVCPLLFQVEPVQLQGPLSQFQATPYSEDEVKKLVFSINEVLDNPLSDAQLQRTFSRCWPELNESVSQALSSDNEDEKPAERTMQDMIEEILTTVRSIASPVLDKDASSHWTLLYRALIEFGLQAEKISKIESEETVYQILQLTLKHLQFSLNLATPKVAKFGLQQGLATDAKTMLSPLSRAINDIAPIPF